MHGLADLNIVYLNFKDTAQFISLKCNSTTVETHSKLTVRLGCMARTVHVHVKVSTMFFFYYRYGTCTLYVMDPNKPNPCDPYYEAGVDYFYLPNNRAGGVVTRLNSFLADAQITIDVIDEPCR